jgi:DNA-directed RNA polymerase subunit RPC12/RpoP
VGLLHLNEKSERRTFGLPHFVHLFQDQGLWMFGGRDFGNYKNGFTFRSIGPGRWENLEAKTLPEGSSVPIFCARCGRKNKDNNESGWRYRTNPDHATDMQMQYLQLPDALKRKLEQVYANPVATMEYECLQCRPDPTEDEWEL